MRAWKYFYIEIINVFASSLLLVTNRQSLFCVQRNFVFSEYVGLNGSHRNRLGKGYWNPIFWKNSLSWVACGEHCSFGWSLGPVQPVPEKFDLPVHSGSCELWPPGFWLQKKHVTIALSVSKNQTHRTFSVNLIGLGDPYCSCST